MGKKPSSSFRNNARRRGRALAPFLEDSGYFHLCCITGVFLSFVSSSLHAQGRVRVALILAIFNLIFSWVLFLAMMVDEIREPREGHLGRHIELSLAFMCVQLISFAALYEHFGLRADGEISKLDYFYFSVVTWTTLGYGDITPIGMSRPIAALEALSGYIYMGIFIAFLAVFMIDTFRDTRPRD